MADLPDAGVLVAAVVVVALLAAGPSWAESPDLGDGTADVEIVAPSWLESGTGSADHQLRTTPGRFGSEAVYLRTSDVVLEASNVSGTTDLYYDFSVPAIDVDPPSITRRIDGPGRYRLDVADVALAPADYDHRNVDVPAEGTYTGHAVVRVQSFAGDHVVANRTVEVVVER